TAEVEQTVVQAQKLMDEDRLDEAAELVRGAVESLQGRVSDSWTLLDLKTLMGKIEQEQEVDRFASRAREARRLYEAGKIGAAYEETLASLDLARLYPAEHKKVQTHGQKLRDLRETLEAEIKRKAAEGLYLKENDWVPLAEYIPWRLRNIPSVHVDIEGRLGEVIHEQMFLAMTEVFRSDANRAYDPGALDWKSVKMDQEGGRLRLHMTYKLGGEVDQNYPGGAVVAWATLELTDPVPGVTLYYGWGVCKPEEFGGEGNKDAEALKQASRDGVRKLVAGTASETVAGKDESWFRLMQGGEDAQSKLRREIALYLMESPEKLPPLPQVEKSGKFAFARLRLINERDAVTLRASGPEATTFEIHERDVTNVDLTPGAYILLFQDAQNQIYEVDQSFDQGATYEATLYLRKGADTEGRLYLKPADLRENFQEVVWEEGFPQFARSGRGRAMAQLLQVAERDADDARRLHALQTVQRLLRQEPRSADAIQSALRLAASSSAPRPVRTLAISILYEYRYNDFHNEWVRGAFPGYERRLDEIVKPILVDPKADEAFKADIKAIADRTTSF
ncbi:MAG: hypothetical protein K8I02_02605, partial [Candidatus Methylomirabilis sp.]|nr:hypothetical protein [Deltaproteobacteria bacterium]